MKAIRLFFAFAALAAWQPAAVAQVAAETVLPADDDTASSVAVPHSTAASTGEQRSSNIGQVDPRERVRPYSHILKVVRSEAVGDIVKVLLLQKQRNQWIYEFTFLADDGRSTRVTIDAKSAKIIGKKKL